MATSYFFQFHYVVRLSEALSADTLRRNLIAALEHDTGGGFGRLEGAPHVSMVHIDANTHQVVLTLQLPLEPIVRGGPSYLISHILGNPFRDYSVESVSLQALDVPAGILPGPRIGLNGLRSKLGNAGPLVSVPVPDHLYSDGAKPIEWLLKSGVSIITATATSAISVEDLRARLQLLNQITQQTNTHVIYFLNGVVTTEVWRHYHAVVTETRSERLIVGVRLCPLSMGLNWCHYVAEVAAPILGYNLLHRSLVAAKGFRISLAALCSLFRLVGCDVVTVGLRTPDTLTSPDVTGAIEAVRTTGLSVNPAFPMLTGAITPRIAHEIAIRFGKDCILHTASPIFQGGAERKLITRNVRAIVEAVESGLRAVPIKEVLSNEDAPNWLAYEREYGQG